MAQLNIRVDTTLLEILDDWRRSQPDLPGRPEAVRRLIGRALGKQKPQAVNLKKSKSTRAR